MDDYDDFNEDKDDKEDSGFQNEAEAYKRAGIGRMSEFLTGVTDPDKKVGKDTSPEDRFIIFMSAIARRIKEEKIAVMEEKDIETLLVKTKDIIELKYKNPTAYVLGYIATQGGKTMDVDRVKKVIEKVLPKLGKDSGVEGPDVVRYARYWKNIL